MFHEFLFRSRFGSIIFILYLIMTCFVLRNVFIKFILYLNNIKLIIKKKNKINEILIYFFLNFIFIVFIQNYFNFFIIIKLILFFIYLSNQQDYRFD